MNKYIFYGVLISFPIFTWFKFFKEWRKLHTNFTQHQLIRKRHNCVVMYSTTTSMTGWPTSSSHSKKFSLLHQYEPLLYFIRSANTSLDIAIMFINAQCIVDEILSAFKRNVKIRIVVDYNYNLDTAVRQLNNIVPLLYYIVSEQGISSILHYKYMVKDYTTECGYVCVGSSNWSITSVVQNWEDINFISNHKAVTEFHENFEETWKYISEMYETNFYVKAKLKEVQ